MHDYTCMHTFIFYHKNDIIIEMLDKLNLLEENDSNSEESNKIKSEKENYEL